MTLAPALLNRSGFPEFDAALRRFLLDGGGDVWAQSARRNLLRLLSETRLASELELRALDTPLEQLQKNLRAFENRKAETLQVKSDFDALLEADSRKLVKSKIEPDLEAFKRSLMPSLHAALERWYGDLRSAGSSTLQRGLEERLIAEVRAAFDTWRVEEDAAVGDAFDHLCSRFWQNIQVTTDELMRYSAELFEIPFTTVGAEHLWLKRTGFYYKFWQEPPSLTMLANSLVRLLPDVLGHPIIMRQASQRAADLTDLHCGRLRHDFEERIKKSVHDFRREMLARIETTIAGIEKAIGKGHALQNVGESTASARRGVICATLVKINEVESRVKADA
jgi:hypothetical protein